MAGRLAERILVKTSALIARMKPCDAARAITLSTKHFTTNVPDIAGATMVATTWIY
jgi:hypothetical protein